MSFELTGRLAFSKAGHDKGRAYILAGQTGKGSYLLIDGQIRGMEKPKEKNPRHVQLTKLEDPELTAVLNAGEIPENYVIRQAIKRMLEMKD